MSGVNSVTGLNSVVRAMTGPRRLRLALKQKTAPVRTFIEALEGPSELRARIPVSVFGGDIFGVMSQQLREALVFAPPAATSVSKPHRRRALLSSDNPLSQYSKNSLPPLAHGVNQSTLLSEPVDNASTARKIEPLTLEPSVRVLSLPETQVSPVEHSAASFFRAAETAAISGKQANQLTTLSKQRRGTPGESALVSSLKRYWNSIREIRGSNQTTLLTESLSQKSVVHVPEPEQPAAPRAWPSLAGRDVSAKLKSLSNSPLQATRQNSRPDPQVQNVFNISVNHANQPAQNYDDLGERIAEILHEQALQHGIDVT
jgi:hypothetical protein